MSATIINIWTNVNNINNNRGQEHANTAYEIVRINRYRQERKKQQRSTTFTARIWDVLYIYDANDIGYGLQSLLSYTNSENGVAAHSCAQHIGVMQANVRMM